jgi:methylglutaconyl-CoA hydratase
MEYRTLRVERRGHNLWVTLNRPEVHNAFNEELIAEAIALFQWIPEQRDLRAVVLAGSGPNFCAGADVNWMAKTVRYSREENIRDAAQMARMLALMNECPIPLIGRVQGAAIGGGVGLTAVCDVAVATATTKFGLAEVKLGIMPAAISPYVIAKIGETHARALFLTGERFSAERALQIGLVHRLASDETELDAIVSELLSQLSSSAPQAVRECKKLIAFVASNPKIDAIPYTIEAIASRRVSPEGQAGLNAYLSKQKAPWLDG